MPPEPQENPATGSLLRGALIAVPAVLGLVAGPLTGNLAHHSQLHRRVAIFSQVAQPEDQLSAEQKAWLKDCCPLGRPRQILNRDYGPTMIAVHEGYSLQLSMVDKVPLWVCEHLTVANVQGDIQREDEFLSDPVIPIRYQAGEEDYSATGFDRGHQAPAADQSSNRRLNDETFYYSNMSPQRPYLNRTIWKKLETWVRNQVRTNGDVYVITGPLFYDAQEDSTQTADGLVEYLSIGPGGVSAPTHFFKIVYRKNGDRWEALGFVLANQDHQAPYKLEEHRKSITWIEERTGFQFLPDLPAAEKESLAAQVNPMW